MQRPCGESVLGTPERESEEVGVAGEWLGERVGGFSQSGEQCRGSRI